MDVSRAERSDDQKIRQYECPSADPCPPEPAAQLRDEKADSPLLGKKAKKSVEMCDVGHTWKKIYLDLTGILRLPGGCIARIVPFERFGRRQNLRTRCYPLRAGLMEPQTTSPLPPTEEQARKVAAAAADDSERVRACLVGPSWAVVAWTPPSRSLLGQIPALDGDPRNFEPPSSELSVIREPCGRILSFSAGFSAVRAPNLKPS
jgi:hypothetical protein